jgi:hypothetical protein
MQASRNSAAHVNNNYFLILALMTSHIPRSIRVPPIIPKENPADACTKKYTYQTEHTPQEIPPHHHF